MTYKRAKLIQLLIADLDKDWRYTDYDTAIIPIPNKDKEYKIKLYSRTGSRQELMDLISFANILNNLGSKVFIMFDEHKIDSRSNKMVTCVTIE